MASELMMANNGTRKVEAISNRTDKSHLLAAKISWDLKTASREGVRISHSGGLLYVPENTHQVFTNGVKMYLFWSHS